MHARVGAGRSANCPPQTPSAQCTAVRARLRPCRWVAGPIHAFQKVGGSGAHPCGERSWPHLPSGERLMRHDCLISLGWRGVRHTCWLGVNPVREPIAVPASPLPLAAPVSLQLAGANIQCAWGARGLNRARTVSPRGKIFRAEQSSLWSSQEKGPAAAGRGRTHTLHPPGTQQQCASATPAICSTTMSGRRSPRPAVLLACLLLLVRLALTLGSRGCAPRSLSTASPAAGGAAHRYGAAHNR